MRRQSAVAGSVRAVARLFVTGSLLAACHPADRARDTANGKPDSTHASATFPGTLSKPIDQYSGDEFYDMVQRLSWGGGAERPRACTGVPECEGENPAKLTSVRLDAVNGQDSLSATHVPENGVVAVRASNTGDLPEARYGFKPSRNLQYYLIVLPGDEKSGKWRLEELDTTSGKRSHSSVASGVFTPCNHPFQPRRVNRVNFYTCTDSHMSDTVQKSGLLMFAPLRDPIWLDCEHGCCIAG